MPNTVRRILYQSQNSIQQQQFSCALQKMYEPSKILLCIISVLTLSSVYIFLQYTSHLDPHHEQNHFSRTPIFHFPKVIFNLMELELLYHFSVYYSFRLVMDCLLPPSKLQPQSISQLLSHLLIKGIIGFLFVVCFIYQLNFLGLKMFYPSSCS